MRTNLLSSKQSSLLDLIQGYVSVGSHSERLKLLAQYAIGALRDPLRADYVAAVGDLSSVHVLKEIKRKME